MAEIDPEEVRRIAELARLSLSAEELERMTAELASILAYVRQLEEVDVEGVPPTAHAMIEATPLRNDSPGASLPRERALDEAPRARDGAFAVPAFVEDK